MNTNDTDITQCWLCGRAGQVTPATTSRMVHWHLRSTERHEQCQKRPLCASCVVQEEKDSSWLEQCREYGCRCGEYPDPDGIVEDETTNLPEVEVSVRTRSGGTVAAHLHRDGTVEISEDGHAAGTGRWQTPGSTIRECAARLGAEDGSETESLYEALEEAIEAAK
jgi:hypothetical protein